MGSGDKFTYIKCSKCGCLQIESYPSSIDKYYATYYSLQPLKTKEYVYIKILRNLLFRYLITGQNLLGKLIFRFNPDSFSWVEPNMFNFNSSIIDIGSGRGRLVVKMAKSGFRNIDPFIDDDIVYNIKNKQIFIRKQSLYELQGHYDFLMLHHVLEHLPEQHQVFEKLASLMHKDSKLLINIPVIDSYTWDYYEMDAFQLADIPRHYYLHSINSITILAENHGLKIIKKQHYGNENILIESEKLKRDKTLCRNFNFTKKEIASFRETTKHLIKTQQTGLCCLYLSLK
ncbi:MAG: class I SAM-dependent methyltransferase [Bacteroidales bacterium]|nr:class I SAM-dependent methyltransferase [Bacteroidales bacterium]